MTREIHPSAKRRLRNHADAAVADIETTILHNRVHEQVAGQHSTDDPLAAVLDAAERAYAIDERDDVGAPVHQAAFEAAEELNDVVTDIVDEQIARACAEVLLHADDWSDHWEQERIDAAQAEAREWLGEHEGAAERAGVLGDVREAVRADVEAW